ncbi:hypothetical protein [Nocardia amamiensis]|uniref:hypothetical protein n=1 Tax=Nocardia amamiensis TaxID=404578 RepID=UPI0033EF7AD5
MACNVLRSGTRGTPFGGAIGFPLGRVLSRGGASFVAIAPAFLAAATGAPGGGTGTPGAVPVLLRAFGRPTTLGRASLPRTTRPRVLAP